MRKVDEFGFWTQINGRTTVVVKLLSPLKNFPVLMIDFQFLPSKDCSYYQSISRHHTKFPSSRHNFGHYLSPCLCTNWNFKSWKYLQKHIWKNLKQDTLLAEFSKELGSCRTPLTVSSSFAATVSELDLGLSEIWEEIMNVKINKIKLNWPNWHNSWDIVGCYDGEECWCTTWTTGRA